MNNLFVSLRKMQQPDNQIPSKFIAKFSLNVCTGSQSFLDTAK